MTIEKKTPKSESPGDLPRLSTVLEVLGETLLGEFGESVPKQLSKVARRVESFSTRRPELQAVADSFSEAATSARQEEPVGSLDPVVSLLALPVEGHVLKAIPEQLHANYRELASTFASAGRRLERYQHASVLRDMGAVTAARLVEAFGQRRHRLTMSTLMARESHRIGEAALLEAGVLFLRAADLVIPLSGVLAEIQREEGLCTDDCEAGETRNCQATEINITPHGKISDIENIETRWLSLASFFASHPSKPFALMIGDALDAMQSAANRTLIGSGGYDVYVRITWERCVNGVCKQYWKQSENVVQITPVDENDRHIPNGIHEGWTSHVIESLDDPDTPNQTVKDQMEEFRDLAKRQCP